MSSERQEYNQVSPWWGEHVFRYHKAIEHIKPNYSVLDLACGNGYGTFLLAEASQNTTIGGDINSKIIHQCSIDFQMNNLKYMTLDGTKLPFNTGEFDLVVSFETIEHLKEYVIMLEEFKRVLKTNGKIILSTPNSKVTSPNGVILNKFHTQEWNRHELNELLCKHFTKVDLYGQMFTRYEKKKGLAFLVENLLYKRGIRKIPITFQNAIMSLFSMPGIYPKSNEFRLIQDAEMIDKCPTLFAICYK